MKKLIERRAGLAALLNSMLEAVKTENRAFTEEEAKKFDETEAEIKQLDATIKAEERAKNITELPVPQTAPKTEQLTQEQIEERAFADFINGKITEMRAGEQNIDWTNGASTVPTTIAKRKVDKHNNFAERMPVMEEQIKVINHRLEDLEHENQRQTC